MDFIAGLYILEKRNMLVSFLALEPQTVQPLALSLYRLCCASYHINSNAERNM